MNERKQTSLIAIILSALLAVASFTFTACTTTPGGEERPAPAITKSDVITALEITAALAMGEDYELALKYVQDARQYIGDGESATVDQVIDHLLTRALHSKLEPGQAIAVKRFVERYRKHFALEVDQVGLDPQILVTINEVLDAVETVALEIKRYGAAQPRTYGFSVQEIPVDWDESYYVYPAPEYATTYETPAWAEWKWGDHWSDPLFKATAWFSGVDSYAGLRGYHGTGLDRDEAEAFAADQDRIRTWRKKWGDGLREAMYLAQRQ